MTTATLALWLPVLPLFSAAALAAVSLSGKARAAVPALAVLPIAAAAVLAFVVLFGHGTGAATESRIRYAATGGPELWLGARVDGLAALIAVLVGVVATAVQLYSVSYMAHEERYTSYSALISLFTAAMLVVVYSTDLLVLLVGWEVMGACSYFLIGHHWDAPRPAAPASRRSWSPSSATSPSCWASCSWRTARAASASSRSSSTRSPRAATATPPPARSC